MAPPIHLPLNHGKVALVDADDLPRVAPFRWYAGELTGRWYAKRGVYQGPGARPQVRSVYLHHVILDVPPGTFVIYLNGDTLDNRKTNLRVVTRHEVQGRRRLNRNNTSGYRGVSWHKATGKWRALLTTGGTKQTLGYFTTAEEAARVYDEAARTRWGALAYQNFSPSVAPAASYDAAQTAVLIGVTRAAVYRAIRRGALNATREGGKMVVAATEVERYRQARESAKKAASSPHPYRQGRGVK